MSMFPIASGLLSGAGVNISGISQSFDHLQLRLFMRSTAAATTAIASLQFNNDAGASNYNSHSTQGDGSAASSSAQGTSTFITFPAVPAASTATGIFGAVIVDILDYKSTTQNKTVRMIAGYDSNGSGLAAFKSGLWFRTPEAINTINLGITTGWAAGSRWDLYGISNSPRTGV
jgi:hypothetical protein